MRFLALLYRIQDFLLQFLKMKSRCIGVAFTRKINPATVASADIAKASPGMRGYRPQLSLVAVTWPRLIGLGRACKSKSMLYDARLSMTLICPDRAIENSPHRSFVRGSSGSMPDECTETRKIVRLPC